MRNRNRCGARWAIAAACALLSAVVGAAEPRWAQLNAQARQQAAAGDYQALRATLLELAPLMPGNVRVTYNLAAAAAHLGDVPAALAGLRALCDMGLSFDLDADSDFDALHADAQYVAARECMQRNAQPVTHAHLLRTLDEPDLLPEDLAYDPRSGTVFVSSIRTHRIVDSSGNVLATTDWPVLALALDDARRMLWASVAWMPQCDGCAGSDAGKTGLVAFDLASRRVTRRIDAPVAGVLGDMTIGPAGDLYVSESQHGALFHLAPGAGQLERIDPPGEFASPQQPALSPDGRTLYVPDYIRGIAAIELSSGSLSWLRPAAGVALSGIDGLKVSGNSFIAVQNGTHPARIVAMPLDVSRARVLEANWPGLGEPTHGTLIGKRYLFIANTGWPLYEDDGKKRAGSEPVTSSIYEIAVPEL